MNLVGQIALLCGVLQLCAGRGLQSNGPTGPAAAPSSFSSAIKGGHLKSNVEQELFAINDGPGFLTEQWFTGNIVNDQTRIRIYINNETEASLDFMLFMAHGIGCGQNYDNQFVPWQTRRIAREATASVYNTYRIPFQTSIRITATTPGGGIFWYIVRGLKNTQIRLGDYTLPADARLRLYKVDNVSLAPLQFVTAVQTTTQTAGWLYQASLMLITSVVWVLCSDWL